jgi:hypothetical protein
MYHNDNPFVYEVAVRRGNVTTRYYFSSQADADSFASSRGEKATAIRQQFRMPKTPEGLAALLNSVTKEENT